MQQDPELLAMQKVSDALSKLDKQAAARVIRWVADRYELSTVEPTSETENGSSDPKDATTQEFEDLADLFFQASPSTQQEKLLAAGYWFQSVRGQEDLTARQLNDELKHLGHQITNVTKTFNRLMNKKPALAMQVRKTGASQQAHKIYRLTRAGLSRIEEMLQAEDH